MPFTSLHLHADLLTGIRELGFARPTPIQAEAIPAAMQGRDLLACAMTGSGKTAAFLLPIMHRLLEKPRRATRALVLTPTRELAAQIHEDLNALAVHTPLSGAAVYGGVGMGPQEHAFRSGVDVIVATPGRLLDHFRAPYAKLESLEYLVLDEADRMLDMGFLPDIRRILRHIPARRQTLFFSATMPAPIAQLASEMLKNPVTISLQRQAAPAVGITQAVYPVPQELKPALFLELLKRDLVREALVFTRTKHRANRLADHLVKHRVNAARIHGNRSQAQRTEALAGFKSGKYRVLVATDIAARGIDVEALSHVVNFDVPAVPEDYIHRVGRTGRAELTGDAFTFVAPDEESDLRAIERAVKRTLPRVTLPDFDYSARPQAKLEIPLAERIAAIRARKSDERARSRAKAGGGGAPRGPGGAAARGAGGGGRRREEPQWGKKDPRVDAYIARSPQFARPILTRLRRRVHRACPGVVETIKWSVPHFDYEGPMCAMASFKAHCRFMFWKGSGGVKTAQHTRFESLDDVPSDRVLTALIRQAARLNEGGARTARRPAGTRPPLDPPPALLAALRRNARARAAFEAFPPSHKREYIEWIAGAKTDETRQRRLDTAVVWIADGKQRNWKYQRK